MDPAAPLSPRAAPPGRPAGPRRPGRPARSLAWLLLLAGASLWSPGPAAAGPDTVRFKTLRCVDRDGTGEEAFRILLPDGWTFSGGVQWLLDNPGLPATAAFELRSPDGKNAFQVFPTQPFFWTNIPKILSEHPRGSHYYGRRVLPPMQPVEALREIVIPRFRPGVMHLEYLQEQPLPDLARGLGAGILSQADTTSTAWGGTVRIQYIQDGIQASEQIYDVVHTVLFNFSSPTGTQTTMMWNVGYLVSFRCEPGGEGDLAGTLQTVAFSFRFAPSWYNKLCQLSATMMVRRMESLKDMEQLRLILARARSEISETVMGYYREHQQVYTRIAEHVAGARTAVAPYHNPITGEDLDLPAGYGGAWVNPDGDYLLGRNPSPPPAPAAGGKEWTPLRRIGAR